jgi:hypothetical protein
LNHRPRVALQLDPLCSVPGTDDPELEHPYVLDLPRMGAGRVARPRLTHKEFHMFGTGFLAALVSALQGLFLDGILGWFTNLLGSILPHA